MLGSHSRTPLFLCALLGFAVLQFAVPLARADSQAPPLTVDQIVARMMAMDAERMAKSRRYRGVRHYTVDYKGFPGDKHAEMVVQVEANPPKKDFTILSETGSKYVLNHVLHKLVESEQEASDGSNRREVKLTPDNYNFQLVGTDTLHGRPCYVVQVDPKRGNKFLYKGRVWIDAEDFAVAQISAKPAKNPSFWISSVQIEHQYDKHGDMWLPRSNRSTSKVRLGGQAVLTIDYQNYELPAGVLADAKSRQIE